MKPLNIFIIGAGKIGRTLIEALVKEGNNITLIDISEKRIQDIAGQFDIMTCVGNGASYRTLVDAGIQDADLLIAVTATDELNLLCCSVATQVSDCNTIARVRTPDYSEEVWYLRDKLGLNMVINPELESANEISRILNYPEALEVNAFAGGEAEMVKFKVRPEGRFEGRKLSDLMQSLSVRLLFTAVEREGETFIPNGNYEFKAGDNVAFVTSRKYAIDSLRALGIYKSPIRNCLIIGGGKGGYYLARHLIKAGLEVKIIERDYGRCEELSADLPKATIINGNGADGDVLREEGLNYYDAVIPYTGIDEVNIIIATYAKKVTGAKVITKISKNWFNAVIGDLDLGSIINPTHVAADLILAYTRAKRVASLTDKETNNIESLYHAFDGKVEAIEFLVESNNEVTDIPLSELRLNKNVLIAFIYRNGKIMFPKGDDCIKKGDSVMIVTTNFGYTNINDIIEK